MSVKKINYDEADYQVKLGSHVVFHVGDLLIQRGKTHWSPANPDIILIIKSGMSGEYVEQKYKIYPIGYNQKWSLCYYFNSKKVEITSEKYLGQLCNTGFYTKYDA